MSDGPNPIHAGDSNPNISANSSSLPFSGVSKESHEVWRIENLRADIEALFLNCTAQLEISDELAALFSNYPIKIVINATKAVLAGIPPGVVEKLGKIVDELSSPAEGRLELPELSAWDSSISRSDDDVDDASAEISEPDRQRAKNANSGILALAGGIAQRVALNPLELASLTCALSGTNPPQYREWCELLCVRVIEESLRGTLAAAETLSERSRRQIVNIAFRRLLDLSQSAVGLVAIESQQAINNYRPQFGDALSAAVIIRTLDRSDIGSEEELALKSAEPHLYAALEQALLEDANRQRFPCRFIRATLRAALSEGISAAAAVLTILRKNSAALRHCEVEICDLLRSENRALLSAVTGALDGARVSAPIAECLRAAILILIEEQ